MRSEIKLKWHNFFLRIYVFIYFLSMTIKKPFALAIFINIFFFFLYVTFGQIRFGSLDDYFMSSVLTGAYGLSYDVHTYFVNAAYGYFLKPFYYFFPKVGWYFLFELFGTFAAFTVFAYFFIYQQGAKWGLALSALLLATLSPDFYFQLSFTQCATIYTAAGIILVLFGNAERKIKMLVFGGLFLIAGSIMRYEGFLLGLPYLLTPFLFHFTKKTKISKCTIFALCFIALSIFGLRTLDTNLYSEGDYKYYADYQPIRAYFGDGAFYDQESTYDELEERGLSGQDFFMLKSWLFYDTDAFDIDSLEKIKKVAQNNLYEPNYKRVFVAILLAVSNVFVRPTGWCWTILCILLIVFGNKKGGLYPWTSLSIVAISIGYLLLVNRLVYHVESGIWLYAIVSAIPVLPPDFANKMAFPKRAKIYLVLIVVMAICFACVNISNQGSLKTQWSLIEHPEKTDKWVSFIKYVESHPSDVFLLSFDKYKSLGTIKNPAYTAIAPGSWNNIFSWGYWNIHLPSMKNELAKRGVKNPVREAIQSNVYVVEDLENPILGVYLERHYHMQLTSDTVRKFGNDLMLLKYSIVNGKDVEENE